MMLLIGMWMSFTKKPIKPMMRKPTLVAPAIRVNSGGRRRRPCSMMDRSAKNKRGHAVGGTGVKQPGGNNDQGKLSCRCSTHEWSTKKTPEKVPTANGRRNLTASGIARLTRCDPALADITALMVGMLLWGWGGPAHCEAAPRTLMPLFYRIAFQRSTSYKHNPGEAGFPRRLGPERKDARSTNKTRTRERLDPAKVSRSSCESKHSGL